MLPSFVSAGKPPGPAGCISILGQARGAVPTNLDLTHYRRSLRRGRRADDAGDGAAVHPEQPGRQHHHPRHAQGPQC
jgi:hypothetical protein